MSSTDSTRVMWLAYFQPTYFVICSSMDNTYVQLCTIKDVFWQDFGFCARVSFRAWRILLLFWFIGIFQATDKAHFIFQPPIRMLEPAAATLLVVVLECLLLVLLFIFERMMYVYIYTWTVVTVVCSVFEHSVFFSHSIRFYKFCVWFSLFCSFSFRFLSVCFLSFFLFFACSGCASVAFLMTRTNGTKSRVNSP